jgi:hypothetical protein
MPAFLLASFTVAEIAIIWQLFLSLLGKSSEPINWWGTVLGLGSLLIFQVGAIPMVAKSLFGKEKIILSKKTLKIGNYLFGKSKLRIGQENTYDITKISNLRLVSQEHGLQGKGDICFDYGNQTTGFCKNVGATEASALLKHLSDIIAFRCHSIEHITFGTSSLNNTDPYTTLHNPDVSDLTFPFVHLKQVVIDSETYDFHQAERFLTYAVNYIGQDYLKEHVEVAVYGDPEKLHPNLRNSFDNLCKRVQVHR